MPKMCPWDCGRVIYAIWPARPAHALVVELQDQHPGCTTPRNITYDNQQGHLIPEVFCTSNLLPSSLISVYAKHESLEE
jgi:hypothetical protein